MRGGASDVQSVENGQSGCRSIPFSSIFSFCFLCSHFPSFSPFGNRFHMAGEPELPEKEEEDYQLDESEDERRQRLVDYDQPELARLRVKQESFDSAIVEVQSEDLETFLERLTQQDV